MSKRAKIILAVALIVVLGFLGLSAFVISRFSVVKLPTGSMANTIVPGESVLCLRNVSEVKRGEILIFKLPTNPKEIYMKRVVGLPGDRLQVQGVKVFVNDQELPEVRTFVDLTNREGTLPEVGGSEGSGLYRVYYEKRPADSSQDLDHTMGMKYGVVEEFRIPEGQYFVLGDSRDNSLDSRYWGTVPHENIVGKALMIIATSDPKRQSKLYETLK